MFKMLYCEIFLALLGSLVVNNLLIFVARVPQVELVVPGHALLPHHLRLRRSPSIHPPSQPRRLDRERDLLLKVWGGGVSLVGVGIPPGNPSREEKTFGYIFSSFPHR